MYMCTDPTCSGAVMDWKFQFKLLLVSLWKSWMFIFGIQIKSIKMYVPCTHMYMYVCMCTELLYRYKFILNACCLKENETLIFIVIVFS